MPDPLRPLRFAGSFFPAGSADLRAEVMRCLEGAGGLTAGAQPRAILAAHAGYRFSGRLAGRSFAAVPLRPGRVVVLSPSHRHGFRGLAFPAQAGYATPLGAVPIDREACAALAREGLAAELDAAHDAEHGIETQLPFLAHLWPGVPVVPLVIGEAEPAAIARVIDRLATEGTLIVLSSDLSHFLTDAAAMARDAETARRIERAEPAGLDGTHACGARGVAGWLLSAAGKPSRALRLGMATSAAVTGDSARVVGYGAWAFFDPTAPTLAEPQRATLLRTARRAIEIRLRSGTEPSIAGGTFAPPLQTEGASFVTLTREGALRGCIGSLLPSQPLFADVAANAQKAAFGDPRFAPVRAGDLPALRIKIAVLSRAEPLVFGSESEAIGRLSPGEDGVILTSGRQRGTFLPMVWDSIPEPAAFLRALKRKAGLPEDHWAPGLRLDRFRAETFAEAPG